MAQREIREFDGKRFFARFWEGYFSDRFRFEFKSALVKNSEELYQQQEEYPWLNSDPLVVKPDMLFGKRGKNGLVYFKKSKPGDVRIDDVAQWIDTKTSELTTLQSGSTGRLSTFIVEPFRPGEVKSQKYYIRARSNARARSRAEE